MSQLLGEGEPGWLRCPSSVESPWPAAQSRGTLTRQFIDMSPLIVWLQGVQRAVRDKRKTPLSHPRDLSLRYASGVLACTIFFV